MFWASDTYFVHQVVHILSFHTRVYKLKLNFQPAIQYLLTINYPATQISLLYTSR